MTLQTNKVVTQKPSHRRLLRFIGLANGLFIALSGCETRPLSLPLICPLDLHRIERQNRTGGHNDYCARGDLASGRFREFDGEGRLRCEGEMRRGEKTGVWRCYHPNGQLFSYLTFANGRREGPSALFRASGQRDAVNLWRNGLLDGWQKSYLDNGLVAIEQQFAQGIQHGLLREFDEHGDLIFETRYARGKRDNCVRQRSSAAAPWQTDCNP